MHSDWVSNGGQKLYYLVERLRERRDNIPVYHYIIDKPGEVHNDGRPNLIEQHEVNVSERWG